MMNYKHDSFPFSQVVTISDPKEKRKLESDVKEWFRDFCNYKSVDCINQFTDLIQYHVKAWEHCLETKENTLILRNVDCLSHNILYDLKCINTDGFKELDWDVFFLCRKLPTFKEEVFGWNDNLVKVSKTNLGSFAYIVTPESSKKLLNSDYDYYFVESFFMGADKIKFLGLAGKQLFIPS